MNKSLIEAIKFYSMGISTIPISYRSKSPDGFRLNSTGDTVERRSRKGGSYMAPSWEKYQKELPSIENLYSWFKSGRSGVGVVTGWKNLVVADFDNIAAYRVWSLFEKASNLPPTYKVKTRRGVHVYYFLKESMQRTIKSPLGIDVKFTGYVLAPPSIHPSGFNYKLLSADNIKTVDSLESILPKDLFSLSEFDFDNSKGVKIPKSKEFSAWETPKTAIDVKESVRIIDFFPNAHSTGNDFYMDLCPFHLDKSASFWINVKKNRCGCHTCINGSYSSIDFYSKLNNITPEEAIREMSKI